VHFSHTPFAGATYLAVLPVAMRTAILRGLAGADVLGFQSKHWAENYLLSARSLPGLRVLRGGRLEVDGRTAAVRSFPVAVSAEPLRETANRPEADEVRTELREWAGDSRIMLRVDRLEPSKNILRGFLAYELFLRRNPSWVGSVRFLCLFSPSREDVPEYQNYGEECLAQAERINAEFGTTTWQPIEVRVQEDYAFAVAAYDLYDVLFVNPTYDGMNLVAMEGPLVNRRNGVLVLSRNAGAFSRLGRQSLGVNPFDLAETAEAIREALEMADEERARRARGLARTVQAHTPANRLADQLEAVDQVRPPRRRR
jgi:trehalose 6-phosphate synthase